MSTFADEYLQRKKEKNTSKTEQLTAAPTKNEEDAFASEYISRREQTLQPERYEAKQKQQILTQIDKTRQDYANWKTQADIVEGSGIYIGGNPLQHERVSTIVKEGGLLRPLYKQVSDQDIYYWNLSKMVEGAQKDPKFSEYVQQSADLDALFAREDAAFLKDAMEPEEYDLLKYYAAKDKANGTNLLEDFIYYMQEIWNQRLGEKEAEWYKDKPILGALYGFKSGIDQIGSNLSNLGNMFSTDPDKAYVPVTSGQVASGIIKENLDGFGNFVFDIGSTLTNMAPSVIVSGALGLLNPALGAAAGGALMGAGAAGSAYAEKIQAGWSQSEAMSYGVMVGASEAVLSSVLGAGSNAAGVGLKGFLSKISPTAMAKINAVLEKVSKTVGGKLAMNALEEGTEEAIQAVLEPAFATVVKGEEFTVDMAEVLYSALLGAVTGAGFGAASPNTYQGHIQKITANEKAVLKAETDARVKAQEEKLGRELTAKEKSDIEKKVRSELEKGYVSTDRIEEILGGESWKKYQEAYEREQGVLKDLERLYQGEELKRQRQAIRDNSVLSGMREELSRGVSESVKGDRFLRESYLEKDRRTEKFTADVSKYKGKQAEIVQKAIDSGVLNNTNRSHELVDLIARIGADKDIDFDFVNNEKLKESGFALDGVTVNGYVGANGIAINIRSQKALNSVVGHEIAHVLEGSGMYNELAELVERYANVKTKDGFNTKLKEMISLYQNVEGYKGAEGMAKIRQEAVADLIGDYLFTDEKFLKRLLQEKPNIFRKIWNEIKYLSTMATGTEEARRLAEMQKAFETVYRSETKKPTQEGGVRYSASFTNAEIQAIQSIGQKSVNSFNSNDIAATEKFAQRYWDEIGTKSPFFRAWFGDWRASDKTPVRIATQQGDTRGIQKNADTGWDIQVSGKVFNETKVHTDSYNVAARKYLPYINDIVNNAILLDSYGVDSSKPKSQNSLLMHSMYAIADIGKGPEVLKLYVEEINNPNATTTTKRSYQLQNVENYRPIGKSSQNTASSISPMTGNKITISDLVAYVKQLDKNFTPNASSKIVNTDGTPKVMYHGSPNQFTIFDRKKAKSSGMYGKGFYFTNSDTHAGQYGNLYQVYLNIRNPLQSGEATVTRAQVRSYLEAVAEDEDYSIENYGTYDVDKVLDIVMGKKASADAFQVIQDISSTAIGDMVEACELFNDINGTKFDGIVVPTETVAFYPEQIKSATDNIGTFDGSNPDIRYSVSENTKTEKAEGWQIKGEDVLLQQEADANGLVWENGVPFRKDLLELARKRQSGEFSIAPPVPESAKTETAKSQAAANIAPPTPAENNEWKVQKQEQLRKKLKNDQKQYRGMEKMLSDEITALEAQLNQVKDKDSKKAAEIRGKIKERQESKLRWKKLYEEESQKIKEEILHLEGEIETTAVPQNSIAPPTPAEQEIEDVVKEADGDEDEVESRLLQKKKNLEWQLLEQEKQKKEYQRSKEEKIAAVREKLEKLANEDTKEARKLKNRIIRMEREKADALVEYDDKIRKTQNRITVTEERLKEDHTYQNRLENAHKRIEQIRQMEEDAATEQYNRERDALLEEVESKSRWISEKATSVKREMLNWEKDKSKASPILRELLASDHDWRELENALADVAAYPTKPYKTTTDAEDTVRGILNEAYEGAYEKNMGKIEKLDASYDEQVKKINAEAAERKRKSTIAHKRKESNTKYLMEVAKIVGDISTWVDKKQGISYKVNTLRRNLEDIVKDADGKPDLDKAHEIYDYLQGTYNKNEAQLKRELNELFDKYRNMKITKEENVYIQMLGEALQGSGDGEKTNVTKQEAADYYKANKDKIDDAKCREIIEMAREDYDKVFERVNEVLREHGMEELKYVQGYFPHLEEAPQRWWQKWLNFQPVKPQTELQKSRKAKADASKTSVAGRTGMFKPNKKSQSYAKERKGPTTDFNFLKGYEAYMTGALDWIYHIPDIQRRRALENYIRITHAENDLTLTKKIKDIQKSDVYNADEEQVALEEIFKTMETPLSNFVNDLMIGTNALAGKKTSSDRSVEEFFSPETANTLKNLSGRVSANMVAGSISSALTNFIPITQSWGQVSPWYTLKAAKQAVLGSTGSIKDGRIKDGIVEASDFLTNRLRNPDKLQKGFWDKVSTAAGTLMETFDNVTSQIVWRSKFLQNLAEGMSETEAIKNADLFAEGLMAGRSRGNMPTLFESKNVVAKLATAFQLEVNNQYGYMFKDMPKAAKEKGVLRIAKGYMAMFVGAYFYNALYSMLTGRDAAFDPIGIIEDMINDVEDDDEDLWKDMWGLTENVLQEIPFVGGLLGGGRVPLSSALPYEGNLEAMFEGFQDMSEGDWSDLTNEWLNPAYYLLAPMGGGQLKKSIGGVLMYANDKEIKGSYTDSGNLRFPVEDDFWSVVQAISMGQWSGENAREYFDEGRKPLTQNQMQEFMDSGMSIHDYWEYRDGLADLSKQSEKIDYINDMDIDEQTKRVLKSYLFDEKGYAEENPEKYAFLQEEIGYIEWKELDDDTKEAWTWAYKHQDQYRYMKENGVMPGDYTVWMMQGLDFKDEQDKAYEWGYENQEKAIMGDLFGGGVKEYRGYVTELNQIKSDKDEDGNTIAGSTKQKRLAYIAELDLEDGQKYILFKSLYPKDTSFDGEIIDYLLEQKEISYNEKRKILTELGIDLS